MTSTPNSSRTYLAFHFDGQLSKIETVVQDVIPYSDLAEANQALFKNGTENSYAVITEKTIFHPQGGGQPSDEGSMTGVSPGSDTASTPTIFTVLSARMDALTDGRVLHFGHFLPDHTPFQPGTTISQAIDVDKRLLYSRFHTAGHVLGGAVRSLLENEVPGFDELKASHFPDSAACEFKGAIGGEWKERIQTRVDEYVDAAIPVEIEWWSEEDFKANGLERLLPDADMVAPGEKFRVVKLGGKDVYPCGGTHVGLTSECGKTVVKKIARSKGVSRVSYLLPEPN